MQATVTTKHVGLDLSRIKLAAASLGIIGSLVIGATTISLAMNDDAQSSITSAASIAGSQTTSNVRFMEMNELPYAPLAVQLSFQEYRLAEMNVLPDSGASTPSGDRADVIGTMRTIDSAVEPPVVSFQSVRLQEMNMLPDVAARVGGNYRLLEMNILPGDAVRLVPPASDQRGTPY